MCTFDIFAIEDIDEIFIYLVVAASLGNLINQI